jgi:hypothetical protein
MNRQDGGTSPNAPSPKAPSPNAPSPKKTIKMRTCDEFKEKLSMIREQMREDEHEVFLITKRIEDDLKSQNKKMKHATNHIDIPNYNTTDEDLIETMAYMNKKYGDLLLKMERYIPKLARYHTRYAGGGKHSKRKTRRNR